MFYVRDLFASSAFTRVFTPIHIVMAMSSLCLSRPVVVEAASPKQHTLKTKEQSKLLSGNKNVHRSVLSVKPVQNNTSPEQISVSTARHAFKFAAQQNEANSDTHLSSEILKQQVVTSFTGLQNLAPNVSIQQQSGGASTNFYIRGVGMTDLTQNNTQSVMTYVDDVLFPYSTMASGSMFDVSAVDIKAGPVGFTHGQADTGGEVVIHTNDPTSTWHGGISEDIASYNRSITEGYISGPISRTLSFRLAGQTMHGGGWQYNPYDNRHLGNANEGALRGKLKWNPDENTEIKVSGHWMQDDSELINGTSATNSLASHPINLVSLSPSSPAGSFVLPYKQTAWTTNPDFAALVGRNASMKPSEHNLMWGMDVHASHNFGYVTGESISAYESEREHEYTDMDSSIWGTNGAYRNIVANSFTQELRLRVTDPNKRFQWLVGAHYNRMRSAQETYWDFSQMTPTRGYLSETPYNDNQQTFSQYVHVSYRLPHNVTIFGGINHEADDRQLRNLSTTNFGGSYMCGTSLCHPNTTTLSFADSNANANQFSGEVGVQWRPIQQVMTYVKVSKGFKPGGFTANNTVVQAQLNPTKPETLMAYEVGVKADPIPNKFRINASAFYYDYHNQQILNTFVVPGYGALGRYTNAPHSQIWGIEVSTQIHPIAHVYLTGNIGYERGVYKNYQGINSSAVYAHFQQTGVWAPVYNNYNNTDSGIPKLTMNGTADYRFNPIHSYEMTLGTDWSYRGAQALVPGGMQTYGYHLPAYFLMGLHASFRPNNGRWNVSVYASNLLGRKYYTSGGVSTVSEYWIPGPPRFVGGRVGCDF